ncbi:GDSL esterase/lipase At5g62930-like isoform X1 [Lotus japonicus]|uniref:SGNH hydrolase-type esterase domain-containing protein n=1 Tax=Lotus japonicus TaxID=34305 RepID=I3S6B9_LOTJA|nr:GDSL esterase/lipase At5g62930-like isoform X1 [Lotus japonicus]AFK35811.1 unknown [Lotus japonicus]
MMREKFVLFGDSLTQEAFRENGWGASLANAYNRKADVLVRGYGGYNTRWAMFLLHHLFPLDTTKQPLATTIFFGANDAALFGRTSEKQHVPIEEYKENLRKMVQHLQICSPTMLIVLITQPPIYEEGRRAYAISLYGENARKLPERTNEAAGQYANACVEIAKEMGVPYINLWSKMQETDGWQTKFLRDGLHLTPEGNAVVYQEVIKVFDEAGLSADKMPYDFPHHSKIDPKNPQSSFQQNVCHVPME